MSTIPQPTPSSDASELVLLEFPSQDAWESFYHGPAYAGIKTIRDETSSGRMVGVEGPAPGA
jgi:uncharacterized protein (DUF1330 family)